MELYYFEADCGCGIRTAKNLENAYSKIQREVGTMNNLSTVRKATEEDIGWVKGMGGYVPEVKKQLKSSLDIN